jgi:hypothetical protein
VLGNRRVTAKAAVENALMTQAGMMTGGNRFLHPDFRAALMAVAASDRDPGKLDTRRLGNWLRRHKGSVSGPRRIVLDGILEGSAVWRLQRQNRARLGMIPDSPRRSRGPVGLVGWFHPIATGCHP